MPDSESAPLLAAESSRRTPEPGEREEFHESAPLLSSSTTPQYDGDQDDVHHEDTASIASRNAGAASVKSNKKRSVRWPSVIAMIVLASLTLAVMIFAFIVPTALEEYAKEAVVVEPTNLSLESITSNGIRARVQANFRLDAQRVANEQVRRIGRAVTWVARELGTGETKIRVYLPEYNNILLGTADVPPLSVCIVDGYNNEVDFVADLTPGDADGIRTIANEWLKGKLDSVRIQGQADVQVSSGIIPLGTHSIVESMTFEGQSLYRSFASLYLGQKSLV